MAKAAVREAATFCEVKPLYRRRLDPYNSEFVPVGVSYCLDSNKAKMLSDMGEVEIVAENITPPWVEPPPEIPASRKAESHSGHTESHKK